jgi:hypothetical protein
MRRFVLMAVLLCSSAVSAFAGASKVEVFAGAQYTHLDPNFNLYGGNGAITLNWKGWLGITGDVSGSFRDDLKFYTYTAGPEIRANLPLIKPFAHVLIGGARSSGNGVSANGFVAMAGGGLDIGGGMVAFRLVQFDWMATRFSSFNNTSSKNGRACAGLVIRF